MKIKYQRLGGDTYIYLNGELDECSASKTREIIDDIISKPLVKNKVIFNFSSVTFMDSTGIGMLIGRYKKLKSKGVPIYIQNPSSEADKILEISGLYKIMPKIWGRRMYNKMSLNFLSLSENEAFARNVIAMFSLSINPTLNEISDVKTAVSEAVTNAIVHGYPDTVGSIDVEAEIQDDILHIIIRDYGVGINNVEEVLEPFYTTKPDEERSGMGFTIMKNFMDKVTVESKINKGTIVKMTKTFKK